MCGIVGFWGRNTCSREYLGQTVDSMLRRLVHRGPDSGGSWIDEQCGLTLGHRRLSIVDLSSAGNQPMTSVCGRWVVSFNGEIYNHIEIREQLQQCGSAPQWQGHSDTETLLAIIAARGLDVAIQDLVGMFAFALWDRKEQTLTLARDRMGEKPLYYGWQGNTFMFASELKALRCHPQFEGKLDPIVMGSFLAHNYIPSPLCIYKGLFKLPPASIVSFTVHDLDNMSVGEPRKYWSLPQIADVGESLEHGSLSQKADDLDVLLRTVLKDQMLADVPLGAFLSGGIDSSLIVALMQSISDRPVKTYSIGMPDMGLDESKYAKAVAAHLGTEHYGHTISSDEVLELIPRIPYIWDEPFADSSQIPTVIVSHFARQHVNVVLTGDGADEIFLGYSHYRQLQKLWKYRNLAYLPFKIIAFVAGGGRKFNPRMIASVESLLSAESKKELLTRYYDRYRCEANPVVDYPKKNGLDRDFLGGGQDCVDIALLGALHDQMVYLPDDILVKVDRASMNASLETRTPFLDHRVVEFAWGLPLKYKLNGNATKCILRRILQRYVPNKLFERPKQGFSIPIAKWLRDELREWGDSLLNPQDLEDCGLNSRQVRLYWAEHQKGINHSGRLWGILMLMAFVGGDGNA